MKHEPNTLEEKQEPLVIYINEYERDEAGNRSLGSYFMKLEAAKLAASPGGRVRRFVEDVNFQG